MSVCLSFKMRRQKRSTARLKQTKTEQKRQRRKKNQEESKKNLKKNVFFFCDREVNDLHLTDIYLRSD